MFLNPVLTDVEGEFIPKQLHGATVRGRDNGYRLLFDEDSDGREPVRHAELDGIIIPAALQPNTLRTLQSLESATAVTPHATSWQPLKNLEPPLPRLRDRFRSWLAGKWKLIAQAFMSLVKPSGRVDEMAHLIDVADLTSSKARDAATRCESRIAALDARQGAAKSRTERLLLLGGRCLGYGLRVWRPTAILLSIAFIGLVWLNRDLPFQPCSFTNIVSFLWNFAKLVMSPLSLLPGVSAADTGSTLGKVPLGVRIGLSIPFATILVAIRNRARWSDTTS